MEFPIDCIIAHRVGAIKGSKQVTCNVAVLVLRVPWKILLGAVGLWVAWLINAVLLADDDDCGVEGFL
jgi:hypothetical protein